MAGNELNKIHNIIFKVMQVGIILAVFFVPLVPFLFYLFFFIALFLWVVRLFSRKGFFQDFWKIPLIKPFLFLFILGSLSFFWGADPGSTFDGWGKILQAFLSYIILYQALKSPLAARNALLAVVLALFITTTYGIGGFYFGWETHPRRLTSFFSNPNPLAFYILLTSMLALGVTFSARFAKKWRVIALLSFIFSIWALVLTMTRGVWVALPTGILFFVLVLGYKNKKYLVSILLVCLLIAGGLYIADEMELFPRGVSRRLAILFEIDSGRERIWQGSLEMFLDRPILGTGVGNFQEIAPEYMDGRTYSHAHNLIIQQGLELGLMGIIALFWFVYELGKKLIPLLFTNGGNRPLIAGIFGTFASFFVHSLTDFSLYDRGLTLVLIFVIVLGIHISEQEKDQKSPG